MGGSSYFASLARRVREAEASSDAAYLKELYHRNDPETIMWIGLTKVSCLRHCTEVSTNEMLLSLQTLNIIFITNLFGGAPVTELPSHMKLQFA
ncbi:UNVERIFIED_CONTAM: hypothetical protein Sradi_5031000 [Sesamum radiatum]|uniref:Uncharacterized protein n=1 Tax=Sesamum radiatum TaxID=300843 RepID=A0AAW2MJ67_SESRA